jgi:hypothetical protein
LKKVTHYSEAKWTSVRFLESLAQTRDTKNGQSLLLVPEAANFSLNTWRDAVSAAVSVDSAADENASYVAVDDAKVRALLEAQDHYEDLTAEQKKALADRTTAELNQLQMWTVLYLDQMQIPLAEKKQALRQLVENLAARHLSNSLFAKFIPIENARLRQEPGYFKSQLDTPPIEDSYTAERYFVR